MAVVRAVACVMTPLLAGVVPLAFVACAVRPLDPQHVSCNGRANRIERVSSVLPHSCEQCFAAKFDLSFRFKSGRLRSMALSRPDALPAFMMRAPPPPDEGLAPAPSPGEETPEAEMTVTDYLGFIGYIVGFVAFFYIAAAVIEAPQLVSAGKDPP